MLAPMRRFTSVAITASRAVRPLAATSGMQLRCFSGDAMKERGSALEGSYFNKEDERLLRGLLRKMKDQADVVDEAAASHHETEKSQLMDIVHKYNVSAADVAALIEWKHSH